MYFSVVGIFEVVLHDTQLVLPIVFITRLSCAGERRSPLRKLQTAYLFFFFSKQSDKGGHLIQLCSDGNKAAG